MHRCVIFLLSDMTMRSHASACKRMPRKRERERERKRERRTRYAQTTRVRVRERREGRLSIPSVASRQLPLVARGAIGGETDVQRRSKKRSGFRAQRRNNETERISPEQGEGAK